MSSVEFKTEDFLRALSLLQAGLHNGAHQALVAAVKAAREKAATTQLFRDVTGRLRQSITSEIDGPYKGKIAAGAKYARFVNDGTPPHEIQAKGGGTLRFVTADGRTVFRKSVHHPGTQPRPFMGEAADLGEQTLEYGLELFTDKPIAFFNSSG